MKIKVFIAGRKNAEDVLQATVPTVVEAATDKKDSSFNGNFQKAVLEAVTAASTLKIPVRNSRMHFVVVGEEGNEGRWVTCDWQASTSKPSMMNNFLKAWEAFCTLVVGSGEDLEVRTTNLPLFYELAGKFGYKDFKDHGGNVSIEHLLAAQRATFDALAKKFENETLAGRLDVIRNEKFNLVAINEENKRLKAAIKDTTEEIRVRLISQNAASLRAGQA